jgi:aryl-alcohol dehydrogenase-like predicted oxidoreductase
MIGLAEAHGWERLVSDQPRYNMLFRAIEDEIVPLCEHEGIGIMAYNPLAGGFLTGRYEKGQDLEEGTRFTLQRAGENYQRRYWHDPQFDVVDELKLYFGPRGRSMAQVAAAWVLQRPGVTSAILGASRLEQITETLGCVELKLEPEEIEFCDEAWYKLPRTSDQSVAYR